MLIIIINSNMPNAKFIKVIDNITYTCNICSEEIDQNKIISLSCNPTKHIFCYDCIFDWYNQLRTKPNVSNYGTIRMCPICRNDGGYLPQISGINYIRGIHNSKITNNTINYKVCGYKLKTKDGVCSKIGNDKYGGLCKMHKLSNDKLLCKPISTINKPNIIIINPNKLENECGVKYKTKDVFCKNKCNSIYGGFCHIHKSNNKVE
jgi:hypothetical protein